MSLNIPSPFSPPRSSPSSPPTKSPLLSPGPNPRLQRTYPLLRHHENASRNPRYEARFSRHCLKRWCSLHQRNRCWLEALRRILARTPRSSCSIYLLPLILPLFRGQHRPNKKEFRLLVSYARYGTDYLYYDDDRCTAE